MRQESNSAGAAGKPRMLTDAIGQRELLGIFLKAGLVFGTVQAVIVTAALRLSNGAVRSRVEVALAVAAFGSAASFKVNPSLLLIGGGLVGAAALALTGAEVAGK